MTRQRTHPLRHWTGPERKYDLIFEGTAAVVIVSVLVVAAAIIFGSADGGLSYPGGPPAKPGTAFTAQYWVTSPTTDDKGKTDPNGVRKTCVCRHAGPAPRQHRKTPLGMYGNP